MSDTKIFLFAGGWALPDKDEFVSPDDEIPNIWKNKNRFQTTNHLYVLFLFVCSYWYLSRWHDD